MEWIVFYIDCSQLIVTAPSYVKAKRLAEELRPGTDVGHIRMYTYGK